MKAKLKIIFLSTATMLLAACGSTQNYQENVAPRAESYYENRTPFFERIGDAVSDGFYWFFALIQQLLIFLQELFFQLLALWPIVLIIVAIYFFRRRYKQTDRAKVKQEKRNDSYQKGQQTVVNYLQGNHSNDNVESFENYIQQEKHNGELIQLNLNDWPETFEEFDKYIDTAILTETATHSKALYQEQWLTIIEKYRQIKADKDYNQVLDNLEK